MKYIHPYSRYGQALVMEVNNIKNGNEITLEQIIGEIEKGLASFRMRPKGSFHGKKKVEFEPVLLEKGNTNLGEFLSPSIVSSDKQARHVWKAGHDLVNTLRKDKVPDINTISMSLSPICGEYLSFSVKGGIGRGKPKSTILEIGFNAITTTTSIKPCLQYHIAKKGMPEMYNVCIIPDLPLDRMIEFIRFFKQMLLHKSSAELFFGDVIQNETGKDKTKSSSYIPKRPLIYKGNFPNPPKSSALGSVALLGAIGEFAKEAEFSERAKKVLDSLKETSIYMIRYGNASTFNYNNHVIDIAKEGNLRVIIDSLYYSKLYNQGKRTAANSEYQKFDLFCSRFLQLFNEPAFHDFLAFRAEYPNEITLLLNIYFMKVENIDPKIVASARQLGKWLNLVAYHAAKREVELGVPNFYDKVREMKAKVLVEIESSAFSAKTGDALIAQVVTRAGRLSGMDAPPAADLFMEKAMSGVLELDKAKNLIIAFSRLQNKKNS